MVGCLLFYVGRQTSKAALKAEKTGYLTLLARELSKNRITVAKAAERAASAVLVRYVNMYAYLSGSQRKRKPDHARSRLIKPRFQAPHRVFSPPLY